MSNKLPRAKPRKAAQSRARMASGRQLVSEEPRKAAQGRAQPRKAPAQGTPVGAKTRRKDAAQGAAPAQRAGAKTRRIFCLWYIVITTQHIRNAQQTHKHITPLQKDPNSRTQRFCEGLWNLGLFEGLSSHGPYVKDSFKDSLVKDPL